MSAHAPIRLILTDIDATILPPGEKRVSARTVAAFHAAIDAGIAVGPCSGRSIAQIPAFFGGDTACCATAIATNGLQVYAGGEKVLEKTLAANVLERLRDTVDEVPGAGLICFNGSTPLLMAGAKGDLTVARDALAKTFPAYAEICVPTREIPSFPVVKANVFRAGTPADADELRTHVEAAVPELSLDRAYPCYFNVMTHRWNKGEAVRWLCGHMGIGLDEVAVFGDGLNDLSMLRVAGHPVAVANAVPEVARAARWHIGACGDDAVAVAIEALARGEWPFEK